MLLDAMGLGSGRRDPEEKLLHVLLYKSIFQNMQWLLGVWVSVCVLAMSISSFALCFYLFRTNRASTKPDEVEDKVSVVENETLVQTFDL